MFGDSNAGKTSFAIKCEQNLFKESPKKTIGINLWSKKVEINNILVELHFWDFSGERKFRIMLKLYMKGIDAGIFMFDLSSVQSLLSFNDWMDFITHNCDYFFPIIVIGTKSDLKAGNVSELAKRLCADNNIPYYIECSSKTGENIQDVFQVLEQVLKLKLPN